MFAQIRSSENLVLAGNRPRRLRRGIDAGPLENLASCILPAAARPVIMAALAGMGAFLKSRPQGFSKPLGSLYLIERFLAAFCPMGFGRTG